MENTMENKEEKGGIVLTQDELNAIEAKRQDDEKIKFFIDSYTELVKKTGYTLVIDGNSPLNNLRLGIGRASNE